jgi:hypothetical protein
MNRPLALCFALLVAVSLGLSCKEKQDDTARIQARVGELADLAEKHDTPRPFSQSKAPG